MIAIAGVGVVGWIMADEPLVATVCVVAADLHRRGDDGPQDLSRPRSRRRWSRSRSPASAARWRPEPSARSTLSLLLYPVYYCVVNGAIALLIWQRRSALRVQLA